jgi:hypothetical protein
MATIEFKLTRGVMLHGLSDKDGVDQTIIPDVKFVTIAAEGGYHPNVLTYNLDKVFSLSVPDLKIRVPARRDNEPVEVYDKRVERAYTDNVEANKKADLLRAKIKRFVDDQSIVIVNDESGFCTEPQFLSDEELAAYHAERETADIETFKSVRLLKK